MKTKQWGDIWEEKIKSQNEVGVIHGTNSSMKKINRQTRKDMLFFSKWMLPLLPKKAKILDCGIGPMARYSIEFSKLGYGVTGVDISRTTLEYAEKWADKENQKIKFIQSNLTDLSKIKENYDLVFCIETFGHIPAYLSLETLNQFSKKTKSGGYCFVHFWTDREPQVRDIFFNFFYSLGHKVKKRFKKSFSVNCSSYTHEEILDMCKRAGFKIIKVEGNYYLLQKI